MNMCKCFKCDTCETLIDCRIGMSNRDIQPFQFACPSCEQKITFTFGTADGELAGASEILDFKAPFEGTNPFVDLHLDFPVEFGRYVMGNTAFMKTVSQLGHEAYHHLNHRLDLINILYSKQGSLKSLITQFKRGDIKTFEKVCAHVPGVSLKSHAKEDVLAAVYSATSIMSSPFTIHEHNEELSKQFPILLEMIYGQHPNKTTELLKSIIANDFLKTLHFDCLSVYPKIVEFDLLIRPALYYDYYTPEELNRIPARVSTADFDSCSNFYKDLSEIFSRQLNLIAGINNLMKRGDFDLFEASKRVNAKGEIIKELTTLNNYANMDLGRKIDVIDDPFYMIDMNAIDNKLRNAIAHYKYEYKESTQLITYYPSKEGMHRAKYHEIYFMEFVRKMLLLFREVHTLNHTIKGLFFFSIFILKLDV
ncbi:hypothetical protein CJA_3728 [Cellvibrio japonicus Ueda107]|uniref:Uncharacterized protein n=2 Tax=Cellvibrio japonicus TaxID=155077 RepID=B3PHY5_CELJU|nr:hypothetical protein CJA_3728 [Cellvibrio japonicus Ueda107]QEI13922.1 hypothetical protein FY117_17990 [Cellvibrio japonicus]QEI17496.1 hypothetical protein FY116_17995 [Cellvibrio japonicus]QEI21072.1 hypothetical protein FY115_17990 [Cellvibrio japonicus]